MRLLLFVVFVLTLNTSLFGVDLVGVTDKNHTSEANNTKKETAQDRANAREHEKVLGKIEIDLKKSVMYAKYSNHQVYLDIKNQIKSLEDEIKTKKRRGDIKSIADLQIQSKTLQNQLELLDDFRDPPFMELTKPSDLPKVPEILSPFDMINGFTYVKLLKNAKDEYTAKLKSLSNLKGLLEKKTKNLRFLQRIYGQNHQVNNLSDTKAELEDVIKTYGIAKTTDKIYKKKVDESSAAVTAGIKKQMKKLFNIAVIILSIFLLSFLFKYFAKKTIKDNERYYMAHKVINFTNLILVGLVLLFSFLENATYFVTVLGFASAGIAIAMKDLFMSLLGWMVIVFGGSFHVGDRIKVYKGGKSYVGDIVDISFLRMTILEDITYTTYVENRRSGRIVFVPNNYVFTELLANYTHGKIKTVWDGIDITITFDSNHKKAAHIAKEIVKKYSKGYTDISRKQLNLLRNQYSLKNINVEPRTYTFIEKNGVTVSCWYMTNSYAALTLRSNISALIIDEFNAEDDIKIAYDTHILNIKRDDPIKKENPTGELGENEESLS